MYNGSLKYKGREDEAAIKVMKEVAGIILIFFFAIGVLFNSLALHTFRRSRILHTPCNFLAIAQIFCDLLIVVFCIPFEIASSFYGEWLFGFEWCQGFGFVITLLWVTSTCIYTAIALERCLVVTLSGIASKITMFKACMTILSCFGYGLMWAAFPLVGWGRYNMDLAGTSCGLEWINNDDSQYSYGVTLLILVLIFPLSTQALCYIRFMMQVSKSSVSPMSPDTITSISIRTLAIRSKEVQVAYAAFIAILTFVLGMTPSWITGMWSLFNDPASIGVVIAVYAPILAKSTCVSGPILYVMRNRDFREAIKTTLLDIFLNETSASDPHHFVR